MFRVILTSAPTFEGYSIEAGKHDGQRYFDHHGQFAGNPCPAANTAIPAVQEGVVEITHIDADTFLGLCRLCGVELPNIDFVMLEQIDLHGTSACPDAYSPTRLYIAGIGVIARELRFPRVTAERQDVTALVEKMMEFTPEDIVVKGRRNQDLVEAAYKSCFREQRNNVALYYVTAADAFDPSRPYQDGIDVVVVYREHYKLISIYCNPATKLGFAGQTVAGITFGGHPQACGSPRGQEMTWGQAQTVFAAIS